MAAAIVPVPLMGCNGLTRSCQRAHALPPRSDWRSIRFPLRLRTVRSNREKESHLAGKGERVDFLRFALSPGMLKPSRIAVLLWPELPSHPLAGINPQLRAPNRLAILAPAGIIWIVCLHPIVGGVIRY